MRFPRTPKGSRAHFGRLGILTVCFVGMSRTDTMDDVHFVGVFPGPRKAPVRTATISLCFMGENALEHPFYRVFSLVSPARAMKRPPGRPEPKMSWFYKGFNKEKCRL